MECSDAIHGEWIHWQWKKISPKKFNASQTLMKKKQELVVRLKAYLILETLIQKKQNKQKATKDQRQVQVADGGARTTGQRRSSRNRRQAGSSQSSAPMLFSKLVLRAKARLLSDENYHNYFQGALENVG